MHTPSRSRRAALKGIGVSVRCSERERKGLEAAQRDLVAAYGLAGELQRAEPLDQGADRDLPFRARQRRTEAEVDPPAERDVRVWRPGQIELFGLGKLRRVAIRGAQERQHEIARGNLFAPELE